MTPQEIQERREALGLSREGLAYKAGLALRTVERIERGEAEPRRATVAVIERAFDDLEFHGDDRRLSLPGT